MPTSLVVQQSWINDAEFVGFYVADVAGFYRDADLSVTFLNGGASRVPELSLLDGRADIALCAPESLVETTAHMGEQFAVIGVHFQKSPLAMVSLARSHIETLADLVGKRLAVAAINRNLIDVVLARAGLAGHVEITSYSQGGEMLVDGWADALIDFPVDVPYRLKQLGHPTQSLILADHGAPLATNVIAIRKQALEQNPTPFRAWLDASRQGWVENFSDLSRFPAALRGRYLTLSRSVDLEVYANRAFRPLIDAGEATLLVNRKGWADMAAFLKAPDLLELFAVPSWAMCSDESSDG